MKALRRLIPRFSLRTLVIFLLLVTSGMGLWWHWGAWYCERALTALGPAEFSRDGTRVVTTSEDGVARIWDASSGAELVSLGSSERPIIGASFHPADELIFTHSAYQHTARLWDARTGTLRSTMRMDAHTDASDDWFFARISPDGKRIAISQVRNPPSERPSGSLKVLMFPGLEPAVTCALERHEWVLMPVFSPDGGRVLACEGGHNAIIWDTGTGERLLELDGCTLDGSPFSPDGKRLIMDNTPSAELSPTSRLPRVKVVDSRDGRALLFLDLRTSVVLCADYSPDGSRIVTASDDGAVRIWDARNGALLGVLMPRHGGGVASVKFSPEGERLLTAARIYRRRRPEWWWGVFWLREFWLTAAFAALLLWSVLRDRRALARASAPE